MRATGPAILTCSTFDYKTELRQEKRVFGMLNAGFFYSPVKNWAMWRNFS